MTLARGGSSRRSFGPPGVDAPATPDTGPRPAGPAPTRVAVQNRVPRGRAGYAPDDREQWVAELPDEIRKHGETKPQPETAPKMAKGIWRPQVELAQGSKSTRMRQAEAPGRSPLQEEP